MSQSTPKGLPSESEFINKVALIADELSTIIGNVKQAGQVGVKLARTNELIDDLVTTTNASLIAQKAKIAGLTGQLAENREDINELNSQLGNKPKPPASPAPPTE